MLKGRTLYYSKTREASSVLLGTIPLAASTIKIADDKTRRLFSIEISLDNDRKYYIQAASDEERGIWMEKLMILSSQN